jgi:hypothetical protein
MLERNISKAMRDDFEGGVLITWEHACPSEEHGQSSKLIRQPADFPSEKIRLGPQLALLFEEPCPLACG